MIIVVTCWYCIIVTITITTYHYYVHSVLPPYCRILLALDHLFLDCEKLPRSPVFLPTCARAPKGPIWALLYSESHCLLMRFVCPALVLLFGEGAARLCPKMGYTTKIAMLIWENEDKPLNFEVRNFQTRPSVCRISVASR